jgi:hypothetical protein
MTPTLARKGHHFECIGPDASICVLALLQMFAI